MKTNSFALVIMFAIAVVLIFPIGLELKKTYSQTNETNAISHAESVFKLDSMTLPSLSPADATIMVFIPNETHGSLEDERHNLITDHMLVYPKNLKIALLTDALFSDAGWGAFAYNAGQAIKTKYGHEIDFKDNVAIPDIEATLRDYADEGYDLIIAHGFEWGEPAIKVGREYPNIKFVVFTGLAKSANVASIFPMQQEGSFLLGALAGMMSKTGVIGYVGGDVTYPNLVNIFEGYKQGAKLMNPNVKVLVTYLDDFDNPAKGKEAAISQINAGADFLLHVADTSGQGVIEAAKEKGIYAFGAVSDQNKLAPETVLTSFVLDVDKAYDQAVKMVQTDNFRGDIFKPGLEIGKGGVGDGIVYLAPFHDLENKVPEDVKMRLNQLTHDIINKKIIVPERYYG